jgi:hypothetical protein
MTPAEKVAMVEAKLYMYWCPICKVGTGDRSWHPVGRAGLIPQTQDEHDCERIDVSDLLAELSALRGRVEQAEKANESLDDAIRHALDIVEGWGGTIRKAPPGRKLIAIGEVLNAALDAALVSPDSSKTKPGDASPSARAAVSAAPEEEKL